MPTNLLLEVNDSRIRISKGNTSDMCGIVGAVHLESGSANEKLVRRMCALIRRRGPDDDGFFFDGQVGLGMRRLAIIDVNSGRQPVFNEDRTVAVVFNGEIYNYKELRESLLNAGMS